MDYFVGGMEDNAAWSSFMWNRFVMVVIVVMVIIGPSAVFAFGRQQWSRLTSESCQFCHPVCFVIL